MIPAIRLVETTKYYENYNRTSGDFDYYSYMLAYAEKYGTLFIGGNDL